MPFPAFDPVAIHLGPLAIRWYALAYIAGILLGWQCIKILQKRFPLNALTPQALDDMVTWAVLGIILGGRLGYVLFYKPGMYWDNPLQALKIWEGGMSFHGGMLGVIVAFWVFARKYGIGFLALIDRVSCVAPIGLLLGRIANFINGELFGRVTDVPWGIIFPFGGPLPRHPSQLYEAALEGLLLFIILFTLALRTRILEIPGRLSGLFLLGYGLARITAECFREPDAQLGFLLEHVTMGQLLSVPMVLGGIYLICARRFQNARK